MPKISSQFISFSLLILFATLGFQAVNKSPSIEHLESLAIPPLKIGDTIILGAVELGQKSGYRSADRHHLALQHKQDGWWIANVSARKKVDVQTDKESSLFLKRLLLEKGDEIWLGEKRLTVDAVLDRSLTLRDASTGKIALWKHGQLQYDGLPVDGKIAGSAGTQFRDWVSNAKKSLSNSTKERQLFYLGGTANLSNQWPLEGVLCFGAKVVWKNGAFFLAPGTEQLISIIKPGDSSKRHTFYNQWMPLDGPKGKVKRLIMGRTFYDIRVNHKELKLIPSRKIDTFDKSAAMTWNKSGEMTQTKRELSWIGGGVSPWKYLTSHPRSLLTPVVALILLSLFLLYCQYYFDTRLPWSTYISCVLLAGLIFSQTSITPIDLSWLLILCWLILCWTTWSLFTNNKMENLAGWLWVCSLFFAGSGIVFLLQLFAGAENTMWMGYTIKQLQVISYGSLAIGLAAYIPSGWLLRFLRKFDHDGFHGHKFRWPLWLYGITIALLIVNGALGSEKGLWGFQPSEVLKFIFPLIAAFVAQDVFSYLSFEKRYVPWKRKAVVLSNITLLMLLVWITALVIYKLLNDLSPLIILAGFSWSWLYCLTNIPYFNKKYLTPVRVTKTGLLLLLCICSVIGYWIHNSPEDWKFLPQHDRLRVWSNPAENPHSGAQVIKSMDMVGLAGFSGAEQSWAGKNDAGNNLPAVQDDFALSFFLYKFGLGAGALLLFMQLCYLKLLLQAKEQILQFFSANLVQQEVAVLFSFLLNSLIVIHFLQWTISWGNSLGLLPVMGQPMTWLSSGNSHLIFVGYSTLALGLVLCWATNTSLDND